MTDDAGRVDNVIDFESRDPRLEWWQGPLRCINWQCCHRIQAVLPIPKGGCSCQATKPSCPECGGEIMVHLTPCERPFIAVDHRQ
jgi:hypothetical protein